MMICRIGLKLSGAAILMAALAAPAGATTLIRMGLDDLVAANSRIVVGEVVDVQSRWNHDGSFILTEVRFIATDALKGEGDMDFTVTLPGGRIGDETHVLIGAAELVPGGSYVLFLRDIDLPGGVRALAVRDHVQGAFELRIGKDGLRAFSQAVRHPLVPDRGGEVEPPGGREGVPFNTLVTSIREIAERQGARREVK
jgi:hypothetical protein